MLILYIHGFLSSPCSFKARQTQQYCHRHTELKFSCPLLPAFPSRAMEELEKIIKKNLNPTEGRIGLIGSSMGGFYATILSQRYRMPAVLINPAVGPSKLIQNFLYQELKNYHTDDTYQLDDSHVQELYAMELNRLQYPEMLWLQVQTGDETLDYRAAVDYYKQCRQTVEEGGDHSFQNFDRHLPDIISFLSKV